VSETAILGRVFWNCKLIKMIKKMIQNEIHRLIRAYKILEAQQATKIKDLKAQKVILRHKDRNSISERDAFNDVLADLRRENDIHSNYIRFIAELEDLLNFL
jgi:hypothetical protein